MPLEPHPALTTPLAVDKKLAVGGVTEILVTVPGTARALHIENTGPGDCLLTINGTTVPLLNNAVLAQDGLLVKSNLLFVGTASNRPRLVGWLWL